MTAKKRAATRSAAEAALVGWPLPAAVVARTDSILSRVDTSSSAWMSLSGTSTMANLQQIEGADAEPREACNRDTSGRGPTARAAVSTVTKFHRATGGCYNPPYR